MLEDLEENRYPWNNAFEFFGNGYAAEFSSLHLLLAWAFVLWLVWHVLGARKRPLTLRLATLYFALTVFTNPAFTFVGLNLNEIFGVLTVVAFGLMRSPLKFGHASLVTIALAIVFFVGLTHASVIQIVYPTLTVDFSQWFTKFAINAKILVLAANLLAVGHALRRRADVDPLLHAILSAGSVGLVLYLVQIGIFVSGTLPYGTYLDAGFVGVPSFGSVSIERGHFGKFMASYYPFFLFALLAWGWRWRFALLVLVTLINFSASSQAFFVAFTLLAAWQFRQRMSARAVIVGGTLLVSTAAFLLTSYWEAFAAVGTKIYELAVLGDESVGGGRSVETFLAYLEKYPLGIGYSGSTLRTAPGLPEINSAAFAFVTQYSLLALPILVGYLGLVWHSMRIARRGELFFRCMGLGTLMSVLIFGADILWFVPLLWLPFECLQCSSLRGAGWAASALPQRRLRPIPSVPRPT